MNTIKNYKKKIILGTAQLYSNYGITNLNKPSLKKSFNILDVAQREKILNLDTANLYDLSEKIIGDYSKANGCKFNIYTKIRPFHNSYSISKKKDLIYKSIENSLTNLSNNNVMGILIHKFSNFINFEDEFLKILSEFFDISNKEYIGLSIQNLCEYKYSKKYKDIKIIQLPFNIIDNRWLEILNKDKDNNLNIFARSIFLQGLLLSKNVEWPNISPKKVDKLFTTLNNLKKRYNFRSLIELYLSYVYSVTNIDKIIIGVSNSNELMTNINNISNIKILNKNILYEIKEMIPKMPLKLLNPTNWK